MTTKYSFGSVNLDVNAGAERADAVPAPETPFRILLLGDFSGRAFRAAPPALPARLKPVLVDRDNLEEVLGRLDAGCVLSFGEKSPRIELKFRELDDFHPDRIYERCELFQAWRELRRQLEDPSRFAQAAARIRGQGGAQTAVAAAAQPARPPQPDLSALAGGSLLDAMVEDAEARPSQPPRRDELQAYVERLVAPHTVPGADPELPRLQAQVDAECGVLMQAILHHPAFQSLEAAWRALFLLVRGIDTGERLKVYVADVSKPELAADLAASEDLRNSRLYRLLVEEAVATPGAEPWAVVAGNYIFEHTEDDIRMLGRLAKVMRAAGAPLVAEADPGDGATAEAEQLWHALRHLPEASWVGLAMPRFLLRLPYGKSTDPLESFAFEEMPGVPEHQHYLWGNPAFVCLMLLAEAFASEGWDMRPGVFAEISGLPLHVYEEDGESQVKPCAELLLTERDTDWILEQGFMPLVSIKNQDSVRLLRFQSIAEPLTALAGRWG